jgi:hypothetical protein
MPALPVWEDFEIPAPRPGRPRHAQPVRPTHRLHSQATSRYRTSRTVLGGYVTSRYVVPWTTFLLIATTSMWKAGRMNNTASGQGVLAGTPLSV